MVFLSRLSLGRFRGGRCSTTCSPSPAALRSSLAPLRSFGDEERKSRHTNFRHDFPERAVCAHRRSAPFVYGKLRSDTGRILFASRRALPFTSEDSLRNQLSLSGTARGRARPLTTAPPRLPDESKSISGVTLEQRPLSRGPRVDSVFLRDEKSTH